MSRAEELMEIADLKEKEERRMKMGPDELPPKKAVFEGLNTNLISKQYSPLIVRKYNIASGWPVYIGLICDYDLSELDLVVNKYSEEAEVLGYLDNNIQKVRNYAGFLTDSIQKFYNSKKINCVEGVAVFMYVDKCAISSLYGDFMNHTACRQEFYFIINTLPHI